MKGWVERKYLWALSLLAAPIIILAGCSRQESTDDLQSDLMGALGAYNEAIKTGRPTEDLKGQLDNVKSQLQLRADKGDSSACMSTLVEYHARVTVELKSTDCDPRKVISDLKEELHYAQCAVAKKETLSDEGKANAEREAQQIPHFLDVIEPQYEAQNYATGLCYNPNLQ